MFSNKVVIITGASSGIGAAAAKTFAGLNAKVVLVARNKEKLRSVAQECKKSGASILEIIADVSKDGDVKKIVDETVKIFGQIDVLVNNAGFGEIQNIEKGIKSYDNIMATNVRGVYLLTSLSTKHLASTKGNVINISSVAAFRPAHGFSAYCMSKAALDMFTKCAALELGAHGIRVNSVNPGATKTDFFNAAGMNEIQKTAEMLEQHKEMTPLKQVAEAEDVVDSIVFLASKKAKCITGAILTVDNGYMCAFNPASSSEKK